MAGCYVLRPSRGSAPPRHRWHPARSHRSHREAPCPYTGSADPGAAQGRMRSFMSCLAPACLRTASSVYRPTRTLCKPEAAAAGGGMREGGSGMLSGAGRAGGPRSEALFILLWLSWPKPHG